MPPVSMVELGFVRQPSSADFQWDFFWHLCGYSSPKWYLKKIRSFTNVSRNKQKRANRKMDLMRVSDVSF